MEQRKNITIGDIFGKLIVIAEGKVNNLQKMTYLCNCECGQKTTVVGASLKKGHTTSCGCYRKGNNKIAAYKAPGVVAFSILYNACRGGAKSRSLIFSLTREQHKALIQNDCFYCGKPPKQFNPYLTRTKITTQATIDRAWITINGIDRKDNTVGYILSNCVPCCTECNEGKSDRTIDDFISRAYRIVALDRQRKSNGNT